MRKHILIRVALLILICFIFIVDKRFFNKELFLFPFKVLWRDSLFYMYDMQQMAAVVTKENHEIFSRNMSDFERVNRLREWVNKRIIKSDSPVSPALRDKLNGVDAMRMYRVFALRKYGFDCGSFSVFLHKIYRLAGYESYLYEMGNDNQFQHSVVLVWINYRGMKKLVVEDPYYNLIYVSPDGSPLNFLELLWHAKYKPEGIVVKQTAEKKINGQIKANLKSFLYYRYLMYYEKARGLIPLEEDIRLYLLKIRLSSLVKFAPYANLWKNSL